MHKLQMDMTNVNTRTITSILLILSLIFAQVGAVFALQAPSCPMMNNIEHQIATEVGSHDRGIKTQSIFDCCDEIVMPKSADCCDNECSCNLNMVSFASIINLDTDTTFAPMQSAITSAINHPTEIFLTQAQRPPIPLIS